MSRQKMQQKREFREKSKKKAYTHFMSLPVFFDTNLTSKYTAWRDEVLAKKYNKTIIPNIFMGPEKLHFTLLMLPLEPKEDGTDMVEACKQVLQTIEPTIVEMIKQRGEKGKLIL